MVAKLVTDSTEWPGFNLNFDPYCVLSPSLQSIDHGSKSWTSPKTNHWFGDAIYVKQADRILSTLLPGGHIGRKMVERKEIGDPGQNQDEMRRGGCHFMQWPITWQSITTVLCYHPVILVIPCPMHALVGSNQLAVEARASALDLSKLEGNVLTRRAEHLYSWSGIRPSNLVLLALVSISKTCKGSRNLVFKYSPHWFSGISFIPATPRMPESEIIYSSTHLVPAQPPTISTPSSLVLMSPPYNGKGGEWEYYCLPAHFYFSHILANVRGMQVPWTRLGVCRNLPTEPLSQWNPGCIIWEYRRPIGGPPWRRRVVKWCPNWKLNQGLLKPDNV